MRTRSFIAMTVTMVAASAGPLLAQRSESVARANVPGIMAAIDRNESGIWSGDRDDRRGEGQRRDNARDGARRSDDRDDRGGWRGSGNDRRERERAEQQWRKERERQVFACKRELWERVRDDRWGRRDRDERSVRKSIDRYCERRVADRYPRFFW